MHVLIESFSTLEKKSHSICRYEGISSRICNSIEWSWAELYDWCSAYHNSSKLLHNLLLNLIASIAGNLCFLIQFMRSHSLLLVNVISWILLSKKLFLAIFIIFLYLTQLFLCLEIQYTAKSLSHSLFHHTLDCLVILTIFKNLYQWSSTMMVNSWAIYSSVLQLVILVISIEPNIFLSLLIKSFSLSLFLTIDCLFSWINSFFMMIVIDREAWSDGLDKSGRICDYWISLILLERILSLVPNLYLDGC